MAVNKYISLDILKSYHEKLMKLHNNEINNLKKKIEELEKRINTLEKK